ncbi:MAG: hypothetical protein QNK31_02110, partial [Porticoccus sp.]|nr:hypothetical protein [Porticoccus sp.]
SRLLLKGAILSLFPTAIQLFVIFPMTAHKGIGDLELRLFTPALVVFFNGVWGFVTAAAIRFSK